MLRRSCRCFAGPDDLRTDHVRIRVRAAAQHRGARGPTSRRPRTGRRGSNGPPVSRPASRPTTALMRVRGYSLTGRGYGTADLWSTSPAHRRRRRVPPTRVDRLKEYFGSGPGSALRRAGRRNRRATNCTGCQIHRSENPMHCAPLAVTALSFERSHPDVGSERNIVEIFLFFRHTNSSLLDDVLLSGQSSKEFLKSSILVSKVKALIQLRLLVIAIH